jgi:hypothetical protein
LIGYESKEKIDFTRRILNSRAHMKSFSSMLLTALMTFCTMAAPLTQADLEELRERLNNIEKAALSQQDLRYKKAMDDFREALRSDDAAVDLYLRCVEKVNFIEQQKKGQDFRNWKRDHEEQHKDGNFRQALRSQLLWLSLTARAAARPDEIEKLAPEANEAIKAIFAQADRLASQRDLLSRSVLESIFARAYNMDEIKIEAWPLSPLQVDAIYDRVIMPPLRQNHQVELLSSAWDARMQMESTKVAELAADAREQNPISRRENLAPSMVRFRAETLPALQWRKQVDLFQCGDQRGSALRMLTHISEHMNHESVAKWVEEFQKLIDAEQSVSREAP